MKAQASTMLAAAVLVLCTLGAVGAHAWELRVTAALLPSRTDVQLPKLQVQSDDGKLEPKGERIWAYEPKDSVKLLGTSLVAFENSPGDYHSQQLKVRMPLGRKRPLQIVLYGLQVQNTNQRVREIFAINVTAPQMRGEDLFRLYQEAAALSKRRLKSVMQGERPFYVYDAQIFFKYLEIARELGRKKFIAVSDDALQVQSYLRERNDQEEGRGAIIKALGPKGPATMNTLLDEIDFADAEHLRQVWEYLKTEPPSFTTEACANYEAFVKTFEEYDEMLVNRWNTETNYNTVTLAYEALGTCATRVKANAAIDPEAVAEEAARLQHLASEVTKKAYASERIRKSALDIEAVTQPIGIQFGF